MNKSITDRTKIGTGRARTMTPDQQQTEPKSWPRSVCGTMSP